MVSCLKGEQLLIIIALISYFQAKHMIVLKDSIAKEMIQFLEHCESTGSLIEGNNAAVIIIFFISRLWS